MSGDALNAITATMSAIAALAALGVAAVSLRDSRKFMEFQRRERASAMDAAFQARLDPMYPDLRRVLGRLDDGVPEAIRDVLVPFFVLYSDVFAAHRDGLLSDRDWLGFERELAHWSQKPAASRAWQAFSMQTWTDGFAEYVASVLSGPAAYPNVKQTSNPPPDVTWPEDDSLG